MFSRAVGGRNTANDYHWRVWGVLAVSQPHWVCPHSPRVCFPSLCCLGSRLLCSSLKQAWVVCPSQVSAAQVQVLRYSTKAQTRFGLRFVPFPGLSSSGDQVLGERTLPTWGSASYHLLSPSHLVSWVYSGSAISGELCLLWGVISGCNPPGRRQLSRIPRSLG